MTETKAIPNPADAALLDVLRKLGDLRVDELCGHLQVTATAVRQRLTRLMNLGLVQRVAITKGRGRPSHRYALTDVGRRQTGSNFADLAMALWEEIRSIQEPDVRRGLMQRLSRRLATKYAEMIEGESTADKMESLARMLGERDIPFEVSQEDGQLPVLTAYGCPYTELAEQDRSVCSMERMLFAELLGENLKLSDCRLDGAHCCTFELS